MLTWEPPSFSIGTWTQWSIPLMGSTTGRNERTFSSGEKVEVILPDGPARPLNIRNAHDVVIIGGHVRRNPGDLPQPDLNRRLIEFRGCTGLLHGEGILFDHDPSLSVLARQGDAIYIQDCPLAILQIQNCRMPMVYGQEANDSDSAGDHGDAIQVYSTTGNSSGTHGIKEIRIDGLTYRVNYQGGPNIFNGGFVKLDLRNMDIEYDNAEAIASSDHKGGAFLAMNQWATGAPVVTQNVKIRELRGNADSRDVVLDFNSSGDLINKGTWSDGTLTGQPNDGATFIHSRINGGTEPAFTYDSAAAENVPDGAAGANYVSPGYGVEPEPDPEPPINTSPPSVTGSTTINGTLACSTGVWNPAADSYTYQWRRNSVDISGATNSSYVLGESDVVGSTIDCVVTATNSDGSASADSNDIAVSASVTVTAESQPSVIVQATPRSSPLVEGHPSEIIRVDLGPFPAEISPGRPEVCELAEIAYQELSPVTYADESQDWALLRWLDAWYRNLQKVYDIVKETEEHPGYSMLLDVDRIRDEGLPWLAQFIGDRARPGETPDTTRRRIKEGPGMRRGSPDALRTEIQEVLTGTKSVTFFERYGSAYRMRLATIDEETPDPDLVREIISRHKPIGVVVEYGEYTGTDYNTIASLHETYDSVAETFSTYADLANNPDREVG